MRLIIVTYIGCIHLLLFLVLLKSDFIQRVEYKLGIAMVQAEITDFFKRMLIYHSRIDGNVPNGAVVFIGDSLIQGLCVSAVASPSVNYGISGDTTVGVLKRLSTYNSIRNAGVIIVAIGVNDMEFRSNEEILRNYSAISSQIPKSVPVVFSAVLPIDEEVLDRKLSRTQDRIRRLNLELQYFVRKSENRFFVNMQTLLIDAKGNLADEFHDGDGVHLNSQGNDIWIKQLRKIIGNIEQNITY